MKVAVLFLMVFVISLHSSGAAPTGILVIAHRGQSGGYPENTLVAFRRALELGVDAIEADVRVSKDGIPVVIHDDTVDRTTDGHGLVSQLPLSELKKLDAGSYAGHEFAGEHIPTVEEALELVLGCGGKIVLDLKDSNPHLCEKVVRIIEARRAVLDVILGVRSAEAAGLVSQLNPNIRILGFVPSTRDIDVFVEAGADIIRLWPKWIWIHPAFIKDVHELGKAVWVTAGPAERTELEDLVSYKVDGVITDYPEIFLEILRDLP